MVRAIILLLVTGTLALNVRADGLVCGYLDYLGLIESLGDSFDIKIQSGQMYVAAGDGGLLVYTLDGKLLPELVGQASGFGDCEGLFVDGEHVFVAMGSSGLGVINVSNPSTPYLVRDLPINGFMNRVFVKSGFAFLSGGEGGLWIVDVRNLNQMQLLGEFVPDDSFGGIFVQGSYMYAASLYTGFKIFDIEDPGNPIEVGSLVGSQINHDVVIDGSIAYIGGYSPGLVLVDVSDPTNPTQISSLLENEDVRRLIFRDGIVYASIGGDVLAVVDVQDPAAPELIGRYSLYGALGLDLDGPIAYIASYGYGIHMMDIGDPTGSPVIFSEPIIGNANTIAIEDTRAYIIEDRQGLKVIDIEDLSSPVVVSELDLGIGSLGAAVSDGYVFMITGQFGAVDVIDVRNPSLPTLVHSFMIPNGAGSVAVLIENNIAYFFDQSIGVILVDVSDPLNPAYLGTAFANGIMGDMYLEGDRLYLTTGTFGAQVFDVSDPTNITEVGYYVSEHRANDIAVQGMIAYVTDNRRYPFSAVRIVDMTDPSNGIQLGVYETLRGQDFSSIEVQGGFVYATVRVRTTQVIDVSDPTDPVLAGRYDGSGDLVFLGETVVMAENSRLTVLDVSSDCLACLGDLTGDGRVNFFDISAFLQLFVIEDPLADFNNDGRWNFFDISAFLTAFAAGCP